METAKVFMSGRSQAVRLPKDFRFEQEEVCVAKVGDAVVLFPEDRGWDLLSEGLSRFTEDYMADRQQPGAADSRPSL